MLCPSPSYYKLCETAASLLELARSAGLHRLNKPSLVIPETISIAGAVVLERQQPRLLY